MPCTRRSRACQRGRRQPVEIEMPPEAFSEDGRGHAARPGRRRAGRRRPRADRTAAAAALAGAERPLIWAGGGVVLGDASAALTAVAEHLQAPVVTTRQGKGAIDDRHPLAAGSVWVNRRMQPLLDDADVVARRRHPLPRQQAGGGEDGRAPRRRPGGDRPPLRRPDRGRRRRRAHARAPARRAAAARATAAPSRADEVQGVPQAGRRRPPRRRPPGPHGRPAPRRDPRRRRARPVHHDDRVHEPHALPGLRAADLPLDVVHGHARAGASPPRSA